MHDDYTCIAPSDDGIEEDAMDKGAATEVGRDAAEKVRTTMDSSEFAQKAKDAAYTIVGLGVMGAQRATAATMQVVGKLGTDDSSTRFDFDGLRFKTMDLATAARRQLSAADEIVEGALARLEEAFAPFEERLPTQARETVSKMRGAGRDLHAQVRTLVAGTDSAGDDDADDAETSTD
jgi:hypothetical protein